MISRSHRFVPLLPLCQQNVGECTPMGGPDEDRTARRRVRKVFESHRNDGRSDASLDGRHAKDLQHEKGKEEIPTRCVEGDFLASSPGWNREDLQVMRPDLRTGRERGLNPKRRPFRKGNVRPIPFRSVLERIIEIVREVSIPREEGAGVRVLGGAGGSTPRVFVHDWRRVERVRLHAPPTWYVSSLSRRGA